MPILTMNGDRWVGEPGEVGSDIPGRAMWLTIAEDGTVSVVPPTVNYPTRP